MFNFLLITLIIEHKPLGENNMLHHSPEGRGGGVKCTFLLYFHNRSFPKHG